MNASSANSRPWPRAIIFDLDGTLVDSAADIAAALNDGFTPLGVPPFPVEIVKSFVGGGARAAIDRAAAHIGLTLAPDDVTGVLERFMATYARQASEGRGLYPGAVELLSGLQEHGIGLALCTNKAEHITHITIEALGIAGYFQSVVAARDDLPRKPHPAMLLKSLAPFDATPADAVMIGDSIADVEAARAAGCRVVVVSYGYSKVPARDLGADRVVASLGDVTAALRELAPAGAA